MGLGQPRADMPRLRLIPRCLRGPPHSSSDQDKKHPESGSSASPHTQEQHQQDHQHGLQYGHQARQQLKQKQLQQHQLHEGRHILHGRHETRLTENRNQQQRQSSSGQEQQLHLGGQDGTSKELCDIKTFDKDLAENLLSSLDMPYDEKGKSDLKRPGRKDTRSYSGNSSTREVYYHPLQRSGEGEDEEENDLDEEEEADGSASERELSNDTQPNAHPEDKEGVDGDGRPKKLLKAKRSTVGSRVLILPKTNTQMGDDDSAEQRSHSSSHSFSEGSVGEHRKHEDLSRRKRGFSKNIASSHASSSSEGIRSTKFFRFLRSFDPSKYEHVGFFDVLGQLAEGDIVLFRTRRITSRIQRAVVRSGGFDHLGIVVLCNTCDDDNCCSPELKQARAAAGVPPWHTLEADSSGVSLFRFTPHCLGAYKGIVAIRHLHLDKEDFPPERLREMSQTLNSFVTEMQGRPYEQNIFQLIRAANWFGHNQEEDLSSVFCSELVAAAYNRMGLLERPHQRPSNAYIPGDFASKNENQARAVKLVHGASLSIEKILNTGDMRVKSPSPPPADLLSSPSSHFSSPRSSPDLLQPVDSLLSAPSLLLSPALGSMEHHVDTDAIERKLLETSISSLTDDSERNSTLSASTSPRTLAHSTGLGLLPGVKRIGRLGSEKSTPLDSNGNSELLNPKSYSQNAPSISTGSKEGSSQKEFSKFMVLERLRQEGSNPKPSVRKESSIRLHDQPIRMKEFNAAGVLEDLSRANSKRTSEPAPHLSSTNGADYAGGVTNPKTKILEVDGQQPDISEAKGSELTCAVETQKLLPPFSVSSTSKDEETDTTEKLSESEDSCKNSMNSDDNYSLPTIVPRRADSDASSAPSDGAPRNWSESLDNSGDYAPNFVSEGITLTEHSTHMQYVCSDELAWLNINFTAITLNHNEAGEQQAETKKNIQIDFRVVGPVPADNATLFLENTKPSEKEQQGPILFSETMRNAEDVVLETVALPSPGWYELEWRNEGEVDVQLTLLCHIQQRTI